MIKPVMVRVRWKTRPYLGEPDRPQFGDVPSWWWHCIEEIWWVLGDCAHFDEPILKRSKRKGGPVVIACYECE